jgi:hypothetical protein
MEITVQQSKSYLPSDTTITLSNNSDGLETVEIAVPLTDDLIDLSYPRLFATVKTVTGTFSANFTLDFLLLEKNNGDFFFETETIRVKRTQFRSKEAMLKRLSQIYSEYYDKLLNCNFDADSDVIRQIMKYFDNSLAKLKLVDSEFYISLGGH